MVHIINYSINYYIYENEIYQKHINQRKLARLIYKINTVELKNISINK